MAVTRNERLTDATTWTNLKNVSSERSQRQEITYFMILFTLNAQNKHFIGTKSRLMVA